MDSIEAAARGGAVALFMLLALLQWRDGRGLVPAPIAGLLALSVAAYVAVSSPTLAERPPWEAPWLLPVRLASLGVPALFWLFSTASFDDSFRPSWRHGVPWLASVALGAACLLGPWPWLWWAYATVALGFVAMACWRAAVGRNADLVESRRRFRLFLIAATAAYTTVVIVGSLQAGGQRTPSSGLPNAVGLLAMAMLVSAFRLTLRRVPADVIPPVNLPSPVMAPALTATTVAETAEVPAIPAPEANDDADADALLARLRSLMERDKVYREDGLSIAVLAARMDLPEYRLRRLINQRLGHRNFSAFVNGYRLAEAMAALSDPAQAEVPVLTIALDTGFQSIGPFNRAFKAHTGMTPTEFRRARPGGSGPA